ncbi:MAG: 50S ribosomal protein L4 [Candidatus Uhrbacteria bacterium]
MAKVKVYNQTGQEVKELILNSDCFEVKINQALVHRVAMAQEANTRQVLAHTKGRGEVRGGGRKPRKQKGTGQSRQGSTRSPIWVGGGITFGPTKERNFSIKINRVEKQKALAMVLSDKVANNRMVVVDSLIFPEAKTKLVAAMLKVLPINRRVLVVAESENKAINKMTRNLVDVKALSVKSLNIVDLLNNETVLMSQAAVEALEKIYSK